MTPNPEKKRAEFLNRISTKARIAELAGKTEWRGEHRADPALLNASALLDDIPDENPDFAELRAKLVEKLRIDDTREAVLPVVSAMRARAIELLKPAESPPKKETARTQSQPAPVSPSRLDDLPITVTTTPSVRAAGTLARKEGTWARLVTSFENPTEHESKAAMPLLKLATFKGSRKDENVERVFGLVGDYDAGEVSVDDVARRLEAAGVEAVVYTTPSHTPDSPRWRVVAPLSKPCAPGEYAALTDRLNGALGGILAHESWTLSQVFYYGKVKGVPYEARRVHGKPIDLIERITPIGKRLKEREKTVGRAAHATPTSASTAVVARGELQRLQAALDAIPNERDGGIEYETWRNVGFALHHATGGSDEGLAMYLAFSQRSPRYVPGREGFTDARAQVWDQATKKENVARPITAETLFAIARSHGWKDPTALDGMEALPPPVSDETAAAGGDVVPPGDELFPTLSFDEYLDQPEPEWLIDGVLPKADLAMMFGPSGAGKSFAALDMSLAINRGVDWFGRKTRKGRAMYVVAEGAGGFGLRLQAYARHHKLAKGDIDAVFVRAQPNLLDKDDVKRIVDTARARFGGGKPRVDLVVIDTFAQTTAGADENSGRDMSAALRHARAIGKALGATVLIVHHAGKDEAKGARGWSGLKAAMDAELEVTEKLNGARQLRVSKLKDGEDGIVIPFALERIPLRVKEDGLIEITSMVVVPIAEAEKARSTETDARAREFSALVKKTVVGDRERDLWEAITEKGFDGRALEEVMAPILAEEKGKGEDARQPNKVREAIRNAAKKFARSRLVALIGVSDKAVIRVRYPGAEVIGAEPPSEFTPHVEVPVPITDAKDLPGPDGGAPSTRELL